MPIDLDNYSAEELSLIIERAKERHTKLSRRKPVATVRKQIIEILQREHYELHELFADLIPKATTKPIRKLGKVPPKYRNPADPAETWSGRGKQPLWLAALIAQGRKAEEFLIGKKK